MMMMMMISFYNDSVDPDDWKWNTKTNDGGGCVSNVTSVSSVVIVDTVMISEYNDGHTSHMLVSIVVG